MNLITNISKRIQLNTVFLQFSQKRLILTFRNRPKVCYLTWNLQSDRLRLVPISPCVYIIIIKLKFCMFCKLSMTGGKRYEKMSRIDNIYNKKVSVKSDTTKHKRSRLSLRRISGPRIIWAHLCIAHTSTSPWTCSLCVQSEAITTTRFSCTQMCSCWTVRSRQNRCAHRWVVPFSVRLCVTVRIVHDCVLMWPLSLRYGSYMVRSVHRLTIIGPNNYFKMLVSYIFFNLISIILIEAGIFNFLSESFNICCSIFPIRTIFSPNYGINDDDRTSKSMYSYLKNNIPVDWFDLIWVDLLNPHLKMSLEYIKFLIRNDLNQRQDKLYSLSFRVKYLYFRTLTELLP